jgi:hypothetical protein
MATEFMVWRNGRPMPGVSMITRLQGVSDDFELLEGVSRADGWPDDAQCKMDPRTPRDVKLADGLFGTVLIVVSPRVQEILAAEAVNRVELLPIRIINHKGRVAARDYAIVNPLDLVDCIDVQRSGLEWNSLRPTTACGCAALHLRPGAVPPEMKVFRLQSWVNVVVVRKSLADKLQQGTTGLHFDDPASYTGDI